MGNRATKKIPDSFTQRGRAVLPPVSTQNTVSPDLVKSKVVTHIQQIALLPHLEVMGNGDLLKLVLSFLPTEEKFRLRVVCKHWKRTLMDPRVFVGGTEPTIHFSDLNKEMLILAPRADIRFFEDYQAIQPQPPLRHITQKLFPEERLFFTFERRFQCLASKAFLVHLSSAASPLNNKQQPIDIPDLPDPWAKRLTHIQGFNMSYSVGAAMAFSAQNIPTKKTGFNTVGAVVENSSGFPEDLHLWRLRVHDGRLCCSALDVPHVWYLCQWAERSLSQSCLFLTEDDLHHLGMLYLLVEDADWMFEFHSTPPQTRWPEVIPIEYVELGFNAAQDEPENESKTPPELVIPYTEIGPNHFSSAFYLFWNKGGGFWATSGFVCSLYLISLTLNNGVITFSKNEIMGSRYFGRGYS